MLILLYPSLVYIMHDCVVLLIQIIISKYIPNFCGLENKSKKALVLPSPIIY